jgi:ribokinase
MAGIIVVGSLNVDLSVAVSRLPRAGETLRGSGLALGAGGKGLNQAIAAARLGGRVHLVGCVGRDAFAEIPRAALAEAAVDGTHVVAVEGAATGVALISVAEKTGENSIVVAGGANAELGEEQVRGAAALFEESAVLLVQLEVSLEAVAAALEQARASGVISLLDPAPSRELPDDLLRLADFLTPNESEAEFLTGIEVCGLESAEAAADQLRGRTRQGVIVTLGERGCVVLTASGCEHIPAPRVDAIDTTGAGDAFNGALAHRLALGAPLGEALRYAVRSGAAATQRRGAALAMPTPQEVELL